MLPYVTIITTPTVQWDTFLRATKQAFGVDVTSQINSALKLPESEKYVRCLKHFDTHAGQDHVSVGVLLIADDADFLDVIQVTNVAVLSKDTVLRGARIGVLTGTLTQWREAVIRGSAADRILNVRICFNKIMHCFQSLHMNLWPDYQVTQSSDQTLKLTHNGN